MIISLRGRDAQQAMAVLDATPDGVWVADGKRRPIQRPKRKNPRHVVLTGSFLGESSMATNRELRRALATMGETVGK
ncbi:MAG: KOW domain-containing RNA-binding protein [Oscillospiraceae bacterium]|nr:KOW domain-containing RNA-binding protein [Oscillospiraceae bacterium]MDD3833076.1 KOW domain-containing RNA-binding protein [Oscillospiraceae bacterium]